MPSVSGLPLGLIARVVVAIAAIALVIFVGSNIANAIAMAQTVTVTVDGTEQKVAGKKDVDALLNSGISTEPGNLVAVDGSVLAEGGGYPATVTVNGELVTDYSTPLAEHAEIELSRGGDIMEPYYVEEREKKGEAKESGNGPIHHIVESAPGKERVRVGETSGKTVTEETPEEGSPRLYARQYVDTGGEKVIALTFDDGPLPEYTNQILDILKENDAKAT
ncbi:MAG TPA: polysaccharide deacetylase family protein, partial [Candidatus Aveggerthella excrementigallinarum]|nr:polysaccharide deacetylase family protein [Candidatus Aveggerthella excrementigallinarum]